ncbi:MAG TPA: tetratricopeptide repeat protein [Spirochaetia bacterium]|nr:tetratricopeptide repeat protein [Spirochaetia bacterium]
MVEKTDILGAEARDENSRTGQKTRAAQWQPRLVRESALRNIDERLAADPGAVPLQFERACLLDELGRTLEARKAYLDLLVIEPSHRGALNNLGTLLYATRYRSAARTAYTEAVARHPNDPMGHVNLANMLRENGELTAAREHYETALRLEPDHPEAHQGLAYVLAESGDEQGAEWHRRKGFQSRPVITLPYRGEGPPVSLLLFVSAVGGNTPTRNLLDDRVFQTSVVLAEFYDPKAILPPHQLVFNAISDADVAAPALVAAKSVLALTTAPVINLPSAVLATGRADNAQRLSRLPGVVIPATATLPRELFASRDASTTLARNGFEFPLLLRTPGFHTGRHFLRVERADDLSTALAEIPGRNLTAIQYLDTRGSDGKVRKYRVMIIDGKLYPLHLAISSHWKVHYFTADMALHPEHRAEDAEFLENMTGVLGPRAMAALTRIQAVLGLDYAGIDFGLSATGEVLLFEANATMVVNPPEPDERWAYRSRAVERIYAAVRSMLMERAERGTEVL